MGNTSSGSTGGGGGGGGGGSRGSSLALRLDRASKTGALSLRELKLQQVREYVAVPIILAPSYSDFIAKKKTSLIQNPKFR